ncbi:hypothetical protein A2Z53_00025 [Candidatus Giovannonibacteria bacterium RIFCSPHIGHO2_02_42_15]|uniref:Uncharacterized protein n=1 Tax=Candidatus Giovannonibacteria bacterium RIFCSPHIGHO2_02_42_15 TaxID=1798329 RepID=A0A1F5VKV2_9BACT|nr:MAG: hypothetical protein A2Z53_00025 [Candidatus Giovannonibacteria bacterium RIFCSPHIGHO2_02_42_15]
MFYKTGKGGFKYREHILKNINKKCNCVIKKVGDGVSICDSAPTPNAGQPAFKEFFKWLKYFAK